MTCGCAACYAAWLRIADVRPYDETSSSPRQRLSLRRGGDERKYALSQSGRAEPFRRAVRRSRNTQPFWKIVVYFHLAGYDL